MRYFTFLCACLIIIAGRFYQVVHLPYLTEAEAFCKLWFVWLFLLILVAISVALEFSEQSNE